MSWSDFLLMRQELVLIALVLILLIVEISLDSDKKHKIIPIANFLFLGVLITGFFNNSTGTLFGKMYLTDTTRILMKNILNIGVFLIFLQVSNWLKTQANNKNRISEFYLLIVSSLIGVNYLISAGNFLMFHLSLELTTIPLAALAAYEQYKHKSAEAGIKMILSSAFSSGIMLFGLSLLYASTGTLSFESMTIMESDLIQSLGFIFFFTGLAFKISIVPFHLWTADVYEGAPIGVTSYLSVISKGVSVFVLVIVLVTLFGTLKGLWQEVIYVTAILTMTVGNLFAMRQKNLKRFLAFSSIAQAGFILLGLTSGSVFGTTAIIYFVLVYIFSNLAAFGVVSVIQNATEKENIYDYNGLYKTNPKLSLVMMLALFSLAGIPPVAGFFGKFFLFAAAAESGMYVLLIIAVLNAIISLYYYLLVVKAMFINSNDQPIPAVDSDFFSKLGLVLCTVGILATGFIPWIYEYILQHSIGF